MYIYDRQESRSNSEYVNLKTVLFSSSIILLLMNCELIGDDLCVCLRVHNRLIYIIITK